MKTVITYGTFDLFHVGHLNLLVRLRDLGDRLVVGVSTDDFNEQKNKRSMFSYEERSRIVAALKCVDHVFPEQSWDQKITDIRRYNAHIFGIGDDWKGKFDFLSSQCEVVYLPRTSDISTTEIKYTLSQPARARVNELKAAIETLSNVVSNF